MKPTYAPNMTDAEWLRFSGKFTVTSTGCWHWNGPLDKDGYGVFYFRKRGRRAHRVGWFAFRGGIPAGLVINHKCGDRGCVNHQHLETVTVRENNLKDSKSPAALNARKTHCKNGHPLDLVYGRQRYCSVCESEKRKRLRKQWKAEADQVAC